MIARVMLENGYKPGAGIGLNLQGISKPLHVEKSEQSFGLGYKPSRRDRKQIKDQLRERKRASRAGREPEFPGLAHIPHILASFSKATKMYQPELTVNQVDRDNMILDQPADNVPPEDLVPLRDPVEELEEETMIVAAEIMRMMEDGPEDWEFTLTPPP